MRNSARLRQAAVAILVAACACNSDDESNVARGKGLEPAALTTTAQASIYAAAVRASFDPDPSLVLMAHSRLLPRTFGYEGGDTIPAALVKALRDRGVVIGVCTPKHEAPLDTPRCKGSTVGYVIRASPIYQIGRDTVQLNFAAEEYASATGTRPQALRFEKIYQVGGKDDHWRVLREARVKEVNP